MFQFKIATVFIYVLFSSFIQTSTTEEIDSVKTEQKASSELQQKERLTQKDFFGKWKVETISVGQLEFELRKGMPTALQFSEGQLIMEAGEETESEFKKMAFGLDPYSTPARITFSRKKNGQTELLPCVIELRDETLRLGFPLIPAKREAGERLVRPSSFEDKKPFMLITAKKEK